jgi:hypothetical protein
LAPWIHHDDVVAKHCQNAWVNPIAGRRRRIDAFAGRVALVVLVAVCAVAAHQLTYLVGIGGGREAIGVAAHERVWLPLVGTVALAAITVMVVGCREIRRLARAASHIESDGHPDHEISAYLRTAARLWVRLALATLFLYAAQEHIEHWLVGLPMPGVDALGTHGLLPVFVVLVSALAVAAVAALIRWRCASLRARLSETRQRFARETRRASRPPMAMLLSGLVDLAAYGSRAPPLVPATR